MLIRIVVLGVGLVYSAVLALSGVHLDSLVKVLLAWLPAAAALAAVGWDLWVWRLPRARALTHRPRIDGLWQVTLKPTAESHIPSGGNRGPIPAYMTIRQSYWSLHARQLTEESGSDSRAFFWERLAGTNADRLTFLYENDPRPEHRSRSPRHLGSCSLDIAGLEPTEIEGTYFTDRYTQGSMGLTLVDRSSGHPSYEAAARHTQGVRVSASSTGSD